MNVTITIKHNNQKIDVKKGTKLIKVASLFQHDFEAPIVLAIVDGKLKEVNRRIKKDCVVEFLDITDNDGYRTYQRSLTFLFIKAARDVYRSYGIDSVDVRVQFTVNRGMYCELINTERKPVDQAILNLIRERMKTLVNQNLVINKSTVTTSKAIRIFKEQGMHDKACLLNFRSVSNTNIYELDGYIDYYYGYMVPNTKCLNVFDLFLHGQGVMIQYASNVNPKEVAVYNPDMMLFETQLETSRWGDLMNVKTLGELNELLSTGDISELILVAEALMEKKNRFHCG